MDINAERSESLWFLNTLVSIRVAATLGRDAISILEHRAPFHDSPPLHVHQTEDEVFHLLEGELLLRTAEGEHRLQPDGILLAPKGIPHTYRVESQSGARWLTVTARGDFERFVRAASRPAKTNELPPPSGPPTSDQQQALARLALQFGIELVGPPLH